MLCGEKTLNISSPINLVVMYFISLGDFNNSLKQTFPLPTTIPVVNKHLCNAKWVTQSFEGLDYYYYKVVVELHRVSTG